MAEPLRTGRFRATLRAMSKPFDPTRRGLVSLIAAAPVIATVETAAAPADSGTGWVSRTEPPFGEGAVYAKGQLWVRCKPEGGVTVSDDEGLTWRPARA